MSLNNQENRNSRAVLMESPPPVNTCYSSSLYPLSYHAMSRARLNGGSESSRLSIDYNRQCWICLATEEEFPHAIWIHPCRCSGSNKWVHEVCLCRWIDEKQYGNMDIAVLCAQCRTEYIILMPGPGLIDGVLEYFDKQYERMCPTLTVGVALVALYFSAMTYGALTVLQVMGYEDGMMLLNRGFAPVLLIGLPAIPGSLLIGRSIYWDDYVYQMVYKIRAYCRNHIAWPSSAANEVFPDTPLNEDFNNYVDDEENDGIQGVERIVSASRNFIGALILPTCAITMGRLLFKSVENRLLRAFFGGIVFIGVKGFASIYMRFCKYGRKRRRQVLDYTEQNIRLHGRDRLL